MEAQSGNRNSLRQFIVSHSVLTVCVLGWLCFRLRLSHYSFLLFNPFLHKSLVSVQWRQFRRESALFRTLFSHPFQLENAWFWILNLNLIRSTTYNVKSINKRVGQRMGNIRHHVVMLMLAAPFAWPASFRSRWGHAEVMGCKLSSARERGCVDTVRL